jgi:hypothetical protein
VGYVLDTSTEDVIWRCDIDSQYAQDPGGDASSGIGGSAPEKIAL